MRLKKGLVLLLTVLLAAAMVLSACSNNKSNNANNPDNAGGTNNTGTAGGENTPKFKDMTIRFMTFHFGPDDSYGLGYRAIADAYMKLHPEIKIQFVEQPYDGYIDKVKANLELNSETAFDIVQLQSAMIDEVKNQQKLMDLTPALESESAYSGGRWFDTFVGGEGAFDSAKASNQFGHILFIPIDTNPQFFAAQPLVYNKDYFEKAGVTGDPKTWSWSEFIANAKKVQEWGKANVDPDFAAIAGDADRQGWTLSMIGGQFGADLFDDKFAQVDFSSEGEGLDPNADYVSGDSLLWAKISYAITHGWLDYQGEMQQYYDDMMRLYKELHGLYQKGFEQQSPTESTQLFYTGRTAMIQAQMADKSLIEQNTEGLFEIGVFLPPLLTKEDTPFATGKFPKADGQYKDGLSVNAKKVANDPDRIAAVTDFLQFFTSKDAQNLYVEVSGSFSPTLGVKQPEDMIDWVFPVGEDKTSNEIYGHMIIEWAYGTWPGYLQDFVQGGRTVAELIAAVSKDSKKNVVEWYSAEPDALQAQIEAKEAQMAGIQDEEVKRILTEQINTLKIAKVLYAEAVKAGQQ
jgi:ABC-type glycerol-3-phosphate transport system substrate-binding protein